MTADPRDPCAPPAADGAAARADAASPQPGHAEVTGPAVGGIAAAAAADEADQTAGSDRQVVDELSAERARAEEFLALAKRTQADFENYRKRVARDAAVAEGRGVSRLAKELLAPLDHLALALVSADGEGEGDGHLAKGIRLVQSELLGALRRAGIEPFSPLGEPFDPSVHEAVASQAADGVEPGRVIEVYQQGYRHKDHVLRPARVVVSAAAPTED